MDPNDILALVAGGGGALLVMGAGAWYGLRGRRRRSTQDPEATDAQGKQEGTSGGTATAVKERPAAPTWADTLSAPAPPREPAPSQDAPAPAAEGTTPPGGTTATPPAADRPAADEPVAELPVAEQPVADQPAVETPAEPTPALGEDGPPAPERPVVRGPEDQAAPAPAASTTEPPTAEPATAEPAAAEPATAEPATAEPATAEPATAEPAAGQDDASQTESAPPATEPAAPSETAPVAAPALDTPEAPADRMVRLRERLSRSGSLGRGILGLLTRSTVDEDTWDEIEETLLLADLGPDAADELLENLRRRIQVLGTDDPAAVREVLREELVSLVDPSLDRRLAATSRTAPDGSTVPSVALMVGVNGTGKTTTVGKLARVLVAAERTVVLGAADTFRAAAADQLSTWGARVGVETVRADRDGADPAAVAFDAVKRGVEEQVDVVIIDTAGRLQNKKGLMDELGKVRRVAEKGLHGDHVAEVLLVLDATTGQNGMQQARVFREAVDVTGIVLTKLDGTAKGGIVVNVQRELGVPVKMVGLGEGMDDLTPFDPYGFVDALLDA